MAFSEENVKVNEKKKKKFRLARYIERVFLATLLESQPRATGGRQARRGRQAGTHSARRLDLCLF